MLTDPHIYAPDGQSWNITTLCNARGMRVTFMDWGATWLSAQVPMQDGSIREALLGCDTPGDYLYQQAYLGATIGRYANRIANATLPATSAHPAIPLIANQGTHQLHGGPEGFHCRRWKIEQQDDNQVIYSLTSPDGDQGYPGNLQVTLLYRLEEDNTVVIRYHATVDQCCPVSLTNHAYFNLDAQHADCRQHRLKIAAEHYLPVDSEGIPVNGLHPVAGSSFDFRHPKTISQDFLADADQHAVKGYDHAFLLTAAPNSPAAELWASDGKLQLRVFTTAPALQVYSGNNLDGIRGRHQQHYRDYQGIALESEHLPDSPHHPEWPQPNCWLAPGERYDAETRYQFTAL